MKSQLITLEGMRTLKEELDYLWRTERPKVTRQVSDVAKLGDRSENAEYIYGKKRLREIDRRVRYLSKRIEILQVVDQLPSDQTRVYFGAWVTLLNDTGGESCYRIVGSDELDPAKGYISIDSPVARALVGKSEGDEIVVQAPGGEQYWEIIQVSYTQG